MSNKFSPVVRVAATALFVGVIAVGCARHDGGQAIAPASSTPTAQAPQTHAAEILAPTPDPTTVEATPTPADATPSASPTSAPVVTADSLEASLSNLDQLLNGVDSSLSGSDASTSGGE